MARSVVKDLRNIQTGNVILDIELSLMSDEELGCLGKYLRFVRELGKKFDDGYSWADMPLTSEEEVQLEESRKEFENGDYLTPKELFAGLTR